MAFDPVFARDVVLPLAQAAYTVMDGSTATLPPGYSQTDVIQADPVALKAKFGGRLVLHGGINAVLWDKPDQIEAEMRRVLPVVKENGGYIFSSDHSVPSSVSLKDFRRITDLAKTLGAY